MQKSRSGSGLNIASIEAKWHHFGQKDTLCAQSHILVVAKREKGKNEF